MNNSDKAESFSAASIWVAYYAHGKEQREFARHVRTGDKLEATEKNRHEAERFLKRRLGELPPSSTAAGHLSGRSKSASQSTNCSTAWSGLQTARKMERQSCFERAKPLRYFRHMACRRCHIRRHRKIHRGIARRGVQQRHGESPHATARAGFQDGDPQQAISQQPFIPRLSEIGNERQGFFETADFEAVCGKLPEYLRDFCRFGFATGWRKGSIESLRWSDVGEDVIYLRAENSKTRKAETMPLEGELRQIIDRRRAAADS